MSASARTNSSSLSDSTLTSSVAIEDAGEKVFVAVKLDYKQSASTLVWALRSELAPKRVVLVHVYPRPKMIPMMGGWFPVSQVEPEKVKAYKQLQRARMSQSLDTYMLVCDSAKVQVEKLLFEMDDIAKALVGLIAKHGVTKLVMGAAADKHFSKKMKEPKSKTACNVLKEAPSYCNLWFICRGQLIYTREASADGYEISQYPVASPSSRSTDSDRMDSGLSSQGSWLSNKLLEYFNRSPLPEIALDRNPASESSLNINKVNIDSSGSLDPSSSTQLRAEADDQESKLFYSVPNHPRHQAGCASTVSHSVNATEVDTPLSSIDNQDYFYGQLQEALKELAKLKDEAYEESCRRRMAEMKLLEFKHKVKPLETKYAKQMKPRKDFDETLSRERLELEKLIENEASEELRRAREQILALENRMIEFDCTIKDYEEKLSAALQLRNSLKIERDAAVCEVEELRQRIKDVGSRTCWSPIFSEFSYKELKQATHNFESSLKIGEGRCGSVFKGFLRHTEVAIKMLHPQLKGRSELCQEVDALSRIRHPNIVTIIGASSEASAIIYEFLPNGSLEDRLACKNDNPPLSWQIRTRILIDLCAALIFLHSNKPQSIIHGDLRPASILLDVNFVGKVTDFGVSSLLQSNTTTHYRWTDPKGEFAYLDPEFFSTGELSPSSDVYSFGIILLRLLSGRPALGIVREIQDAVERGRLQTLLDPTAGDWPFLMAKQLAQLGLSCCEVMRKSRPDLAKDVWGILEPMRKLSHKFSLMSVEVETQKLFSLG